MAHITIEAEMSSRIRQRSDTSTRADKPGCHLLAVAAMLCIATPVTARTPLPQRVGDEQDTLTTDDVTWAKRESEANLRARNRTVTPDEVELSSVYSAGLRYYKQVRKTRSSAVAGRMTARYLRHDGAVRRVTYEPAGDVIRFELSSGLVGTLHLFKLEQRDPF